MQTEKNAGMGQSPATTFLIACGAIGPLLALSALDEGGILSGAPVGLLQRISIIVGWGWIALFALRLLGKMRSSIPAHREAVES